jgi:eukaryotic translation initiation factor 2-alpha kinase 4
MFSLGIIFFEMSYPLPTAMQRVDDLKRLRGLPPTLPTAFKPKTETHSGIILSLVAPNPDDRPTAAELLSSEKLPLPQENESTRRELVSLLDPRFSSHQQALDILFDRTIDKARDYVWDKNTHDLTFEHLMPEYRVKSSLVSVFRRYGAMEIKQNLIHPKSSLYEQPIVKLLDEQGTVLQLPYDMRMGYARMLARDSKLPSILRSWTFGSVFRPRAGGGQPIVLDTVDFDIVSEDNADAALEEAEAIQVLEDIILAFPGIYTRKTSVLLGHSGLLQLILDFCGVDSKSWRHTSNILSGLNVGEKDWQKIRTELRSPPVSASATSVDQLQKFDFRGKVH